MKKKVFAILLAGFIAMNTPAFAGTINGSIVTIDDFGIMNIHVSNPAIVSVQLIGITNNCYLTFEGCQESACTYTLNAPLPLGIIDVVVTGTNNAVFSEKIVVTE